MKEAESMRYDTKGKYGVTYNRDGVDELIGVYSTRERAEKAAARAAERVAYGMIQIECPTERYEYWPTYKRNKRQRA